MIRENLGLQKPNYQTMSYEELEADPVAEPILQQKALEYLRAKDKEYFERNFTGAFDSEGYLIKKGSAGSGSIKPSQSIGDAGLQEVLENTKRELASKFRETLLKSASSLETSQQSIADKKLTLAIAKTNDLSSLGKIIEENGGLQGSQKFYTVEELSSLISRVMNKGENPMLITSAFGLRQKVLDLIKIDQLRESIK